MNTIAKIILWVLLIAISCCNNNSAYEQKGGTISKEFIQYSLKSNQKLHIGVISKNEHIPLLFAQHAKLATGNTLFQDKGLDINISEDDISLLIRNIENDSLQLAIVPLYEFLNIDRDKLSSSLTIFLGTSYSAGYHTLVCNLAINDITMLTGKKLAVTPNSSEFHMIDFFLKLNGLTPDSIELIYTKNSDQALALFQRGEVMAAALSGIPPADVKILFSTKDASYFVPYVAIAKDQNILANKQQLVEFSEVLITANALLYSNPQLINKIPNDIFNTMTTPAAYLRLFTPLSFSDNLSFFALTENSDTNINTLLNISQFLPQQFYEVTTKSVFTLYSPFVVEALQATPQQINSEHIHNFSMNSKSSALFPISIPFENEQMTITSKQERIFKKIRTLAKLFPSATLRLSYRPKNNETARYVIEQRIQNSSRILYALFKDRKNLRIDTDYTTLSKIYSNTYTGPFAESSSLIIEFLAVNND